MLYRPEVFEALTEERWNADRIRESIREVVADTDDALRGPRLLWRANDWDRWQATSPMKNLYVGAAGVLWALDELRRLGHAETRLDLAELALSNLELYRARPDQMKIGLPEPRGKAFARSGDERWLDRARRFAVHALTQVKRLRAEAGRGRYSLWTGDLGVAVYAADCLDARSAYPFFDRRSRLPD